MLKNYLMIALRNLIKHKTYSAITIAGLAIGLACCIVILMYIQDELSYDRYHGNAKNIYRLAIQGVAEGKEFNMAKAAIPWGPALSEEFSEVLHAVRFKPPFLKWHLQYGDKQFHEEKFAIVDSNIFAVFDFELVKGNPETALNKPNAIVLSERMAQKYFGDEDPMGKRIIADNDWYFEVAGVMKNIPRNSHYIPEFLASFATWNNALGQGVNNWFDYNYYTYLLLPDGFDPADLEKQFPAFIEKRIGSQLERAKMSLTPYLQPLTDIHLHSHLEAELGPNGNITTIYIFVAVAVFIMLIACINFMNLATARSSSRQKEVGLRKVAGAHRGQLVKQFLSESLFLTTLAFIVAIGFAALLLPVFADLSGKEIDPATALGNPLFLLGMAVLVVLVGIFAGSYPAFFLSSFNPVSLLQRTTTMSATSSALRKFLVITQFVISIVMLIGTGVVYNQLAYLKNGDAGFQKENIVIIPMIEANLRAKFPSFQDQAINGPGVLSVGAARELPGGAENFNMLLPQGAGNDGQMLVNTMAVDYDFLSTLSMEVVTGRDFSRTFGADSAEAFIVNQAFVAQVGWQDPIGKTLKWGNFKNGKVVGVVRDFHFKSLHHSIEPFVFHVGNPGFYQYILVKVDPQKHTQAVAALRAAWLDNFPNQPFEYKFLKDKINDLYKEENTLGSLVLAFTLLSILTACLGLFALASYSAEQRTKEIGIRKVLGSSTSGIVYMLTREFAVLVLIANFFAWPIAWYAADLWLRDFAYRISPGLLTFVFAGLLTLIVALATVGLNAMRAAGINPVRALRFE